MSQLFPPSANTLARVTLLGAFVLVTGSGAAVWIVFRSSYLTERKIVRNQPVPFSHKHHVGGIGIDCRYCHTTVDTTSFAGVPPTDTCMSCHSQIWTNAELLEPVRDSLRNDQPLHWNRVNDLPDYVYFNHSIHINKGVGCETCHGRVDQMPLMLRAQSLQMGWCLDCHRHPEEYVRPREDVFTMGYRPAIAQEVLGTRLVREYHVQKLTDCYTCHR
jgi:hypothetical protein